MCQEQKTRKCIVKGNPHLNRPDRNAYFHLFGIESDENGSTILAIVEYEDGTVEDIPATWVKFESKPIK